MDRAAGLEVLRRMVLIRRFDEALFDWVQEFPGGWHVSIGQEVIATAVSLVRAAGDVAVSTHRNHGHNLAFGADPRRLMAEIFGRATGYAGGKAGSFHCAVPELGLICSPAIVAAGLPIACGLALAGRVLGEARVAVAFFGNGTLNEGAFHETINLASLLRLPVVFICENNSGAPGGPASDLAAADIGGFVSAYGVRSSSVGGADYLAVERAAEDAFACARGRDGPAFLEVRTQPWPGGRTNHPRGLGRTPLFGEASNPEDAAWAPSDGLRLWVRTMLAEGWAAREDVEEVDREVSAEVADAVTFAQASPPPPQSALLQDVFAAP